MPSPAGVAYFLAYVIIPLIKVIVRIDPRLKVKIVRIRKAKNEMYAF